MNRALAYGVVLAAAAMAVGCDARPLDVGQRQVVVDAGNTERGACLLEYNYALVPPEADPCCAWEGGPNTCDRDIACNESSGSGCCKIYYFSSWSQGAAGCCLYESDLTSQTGTGDRTEECGELLATGR